MDIHFNLEFKINFKNNYEIQSKFKMFNFRYSVEVTF